MCHLHSAVHPALTLAFDEASANICFPKATIRCAHHAVFRSQLARDLGCLLDLDPAVVAWSCFPLCFETLRGTHVPDLLAEYADGTRMLMDVCEEAEDHPWIAEGAACSGHRHRFVSRAEIEAGYRLQNAKDLLRYANFRTPLNDRIRLLAALDEVGSMTIKEAFHAFREVQPMTGLAWLALHHFISIDIDEALIGPDTIVRLFPR